MEKCLFLIIIFLGAYAQEKNVPPTVSLAKSCRPWQDSVCHRTVAVSTLSKTEKGPVTKPITVWPESREVTPLASREKGKLTGRLHKKGRP